MSTCSERTPRRQRGDMLVESLVGLLLLAIVGAGMGTMAARMQASQRDAKVEALAVVTLRQLLREQGEALCDGPAARSEPLAGNTGLVLQVQVRCDAPQSVAVSAAGAGTRVVEAPREVTLAVAAAQLGLAEGSPSLVVGTTQ